MKSSPRRSPTRSISWSRVASSTVLRQRNTAARRRCSGGGTSPYKQAFVAVRFGPSVEGEVSLRVCVAARQPRRDFFSLPRARAREASKNPFNLNLLRGGDQRRQEH